MKRYYVEITLPDGKMWKLDERAERTDAFKDLVKALETVPVDSVLRVCETRKDNK